MSMLESFAASRRTSAWRCWSASLDSALKTILYLPFDAWLHFLAAVVKAPDGSLKTQRLIVAVPPEELPPPPQPAMAHSTAAARAAADTLRPMSCVLPLGHGFATRATKPSPGARVRGAVPCASASWVWRSTCPAGGAARG